MTATGGGAAGPESAQVSGASRWQKVVGIIGVGVVAWVGASLLDIVTSGGSRPGAGGHVTEDGTPHSGNPHDPSRFDH